MPSIGQCSNSWSKTARAAARHRALVADRAPEIREALAARPRAPPSSQPSASTTAFIAPALVPVMRLDLEAPVLEERVEHAPGEGAMRAAALQREIDRLLAAGPASLRAAAGARMAFITAAVQPPSIEQIGAGDLTRRRRSTGRRASAATCSTVTNCLVGCAVSSTSLMTCSSVMSRAFIVSGICFSTSGVQT